jgi:hypothetical protein
MQIEKLSEGQVKSPFYLEERKRDTSNDVKAKY